MPRLDRRFTDEDIIRIIRRNLNAQRRRNVINAICQDSTQDDIFDILLDFLSELGGNLGVIGGILSLLRNIERRFEFRVDLFERLKEFLDGR